MKTFNIHQAKTNLTQLLSRVKLGEEIVIANRGIPIAKLIPFHKPQTRRASLGCDRGRFTVPDDFNQPLPTEVMTAVERQIG